MFTYIPILLTLTAPIPANDAAAIKKEQEAAWVGLISDNQSMTRAILTFAARPKETTAFFKDKLKPLKLEEAKAKSLIANIASDDEKVWKPAFDECLYFDPRLAMSLQSIIDETTVGEHRGRVVMMLGDIGSANVEKMKEHYNFANINLRPSGNGDYNFFDGRMSWWAEHQLKRLGGSGNSETKKQWSRAIRSMIILEHFATEDAIGIIKSMSTGHAEASPTIAAKECLKRLKVEK